MFLPLGAGTTAAYFQNCFVAMRAPGEMSKPSYATYVKGRLAGFVKVTGGPQYVTDPYPFNSLQPRYRAIYDAFGPRRMFWGITRMPCTWRECITHFTEHQPWLNEVDKALIMARPSPIGSAGSGREGLECDGAGLGPSLGWQPNHRHSQGAQRP